MVQWSKINIEFSYLPSVVACALIPLIGGWTLRTVGLKKLRMNMKLVSRTGPKYKKKHEILVLRPGQEGRMKAEEAE
jgi:hypothetical protein